MEIIVGNVRMLNEMLLILLNLSYKDKRVYSECFQINFNLNYNINLKKERTYRRSADLFFVSLGS